MSWLKELKELANLKITENIIYALLTNRMCAMISCSVVSNSVAHQVPLSMRIIQARILGWVAMPFSRGSSQPRD